MADANPHDLSPGRRWIGGANLPTRDASRVNATRPLAELAVANGAIELRLRGPLASVTRAETLHARSGELEIVFPIRSKLGFGGVGFQRPDGREYYFKTRRIDEVLDVLRVAGFPVSSEARPPRKMRSREP